MGKSTGITWADHTFNGVIGCTKVSPACTHCYAENDTPARINRKMGLELWGPKAARRSASEKMWQDLYRWNNEAKKAKQRRKVFCYSQGDVFEAFTQQLVNHKGEPLYYGDSGMLTTIDTGIPFTSLEARHRLFTAIENYEWLIFLLLTKRPENVNGMVFPQWINGHWPRNAWIGTTTENQEYANERIKHLINIPAKIRFLSVEPMLGPVNLYEDINEYIQWVIVGGESRHSKPTEARIMEDGWVDDLRKQCLRMKIPFFFKQWGEWIPFKHIPERLFSEPPPSLAEIEVAYPRKVINGQSYHCIGKKHTGDEIASKQHHNFPKEANLIPGDY